jgi:hypothetical protein
MMEIEAKIIVNITTMTVLKLKEEVQEAKIGPPVVALETAFTLAKPIASECDPSVSQRIRGEYF